MRLSERERERERERGMIQNERLREREREREWAITNFHARLTSTIVISKRVSEPSFNVNFVSFVDGDSYFFLPSSSHSVVSHLTSPCKPSSLLFSPMTFYPPEYCFIFLLLLLCIFFTNSSWVSSQCLANQSSLLLNLKHGFSFPDSSRLSNWIKDSNCCSWEGVTCDNITGFVTGLDLSSATQQEISGKIDASLLQLQKLQTLDLSYNNFSSSMIPSGLKNLTSLTHLNLSNAGFRGQIPLEISRMNWLVSLDLSTSFIKSKPSTALKLENPDLKTLLQNLTALQELRLDGIRLSMAGTGWSRVVSSSLPNLKVLSLSNCLLPGPIDASLLRLTFLAELHLDGNNLSSLTNDTFSDYSSIKLRYLNLATCKLSGQLPENIFRLPNLHTLDISNNPNLTGSFPSFPRNSSSLEFLRLSHTKLGGSLPGSISNLKFLKRLKLNNCNFSGTIPFSLKDLTQLLVMDLSFNHFRGPIPLLESQAILLIDLSNNYLSGDIPSSFGRLRSLTKLDLRNNTLNGTIPQSLLSLPALQTINLSQNRLQGPLPAFTNQMSLETLDLSYNMLNGSIPLSITNAIQLKVFVLSYNNFSGFVDIGLFQSFKNLTSLDLSGNKFTVESNNASISGIFPQISSLKLSSCNINEFPRFLYNQTRLDNLDLSSNKLLGDIPTWIWQIGNGNLFQLNLSHNSLTGIGHIDLSLSSMGILDLHSNMLEGSLLLPSKASVLDYSNNRFTSTIPVNIGRSIEYTFFLSLASNNFTGEIPITICDGGSYLNVLDMSENNLSGTIPVCLMNISSSLSVLNLRGNNLHGTIPGGSISRNLRTLDLNSNRLSGSIPRSLSNCMVLEVLNLGNNNLHDTFPSWLENLPQLRVLVLRSNQLHGAIEQIKTQNGFPALQIIDISSNTFTGNLPERFFRSWKTMMMDGENKGNQPNSFLRFHALEFSPVYYQDAVTVTAKGREMEFVKILTLLTAIDFSRNRFSGRIPDELGSLNFLYVLNMSHNSLSGPIPVALGSLSYLESMDLSHNNLSGKIPAELTRLTFLAVLDLSYNQLNGRIPMGAQFSTFSNTSFEGNLRLCGLPVSLSCPPPPDGEASTPANKKGVDWQFIMIGVGFGGGMGMEMGALMFWKKGRRWYNGHVDGMLLSLLTVFGLICITNERGDAEEKVGFFTYADRNEEDEEDEVAFNRQFCVFCTKLDVGGTRAIHNNCSCLLLETLTFPSPSI